MASTNLPARRHKGEHCPNALTHPRCLVCSAVLFQLTMLKRVQVVAQCFNLCSCLLHLHVFVFRVLCISGTWKLSGHIPVHVNTNLVPCLGKLTIMHHCRCPRTPYSALKSAASIFEHRQVCQVGDRDLPSYGPNFVASKKQIAWRRRLQEQIEADMQERLISAPTQWGMQPGTIHNSPICCLACRYVR